MYENGSVPIRRNPNPNPVTLNPKPNPNPNFSEWVSANREDTTKTVTCSFS